MPSRRADSAVGANAELRPLPAPTWVCPHGRVLCDCHHAAPVELECLAAPDYSDVLERIATALNRIADAQESRKPHVAPMGFLR